MKKLKLHEILQTKKIEQNLMDAYECIMCAHVVQLHAQVIGGMVINI